MRLLSAALFFFPFYDIGSKGVEDEAHAYAVYRLQDEADDWEKSYRAHPSILDSALQSGSVIGAARAKPS